MSYKFYVTDWIPELGRYAIITSAFQDGHNFAAEAFVFALDTKPFFDGIRLTYPFNETIEKWCHVDEAHMLEAALELAQPIINLQKAGASRKTRSVDINRRGFESHEVKLCFVILAEIREKYEKKLKELADEAWSKDLRQILSAFLKIVVKVEPYKPK